jgi:hypothetical protein
MEKKLMNDQSKKRFGGGRGKGKICDKALMLCYVAGAVGFLQGSISCLAWSTWQINHTAAAEILVLTLNGILHLSPTYTFPVLYSFS